MAFTLAREAEEPERGIIVVPGSGQRPDHPGTWHGPADRRSERPDLPGPSYVRAPCRSRCTRSTAGASPTGCCSSSTATAPTSSTWPPTARWSIPRPASWWPPPEGPSICPPTAPPGGEIDTETFEFDFSALPSFAGRPRRGHRPALRRAGLRPLPGRHRRVLPGWRLCLALAFRRERLRPPGRRDLPLRLPPRAVRGRLGRRLGLRRAGVRRPWPPTILFSASTGPSGWSSTLQGAGVHVEYHDYPMAHDISLDELVDLRAWLAAR